MRSSIAIVFSTLAVLQSSLAATSGLGVSTNAQCGPNTGLTCAGSQFGNCCSQFGYCGSTWNYCNGGCQPDYGNCKESSFSNSHAKSHYKHNGTVAVTRRAA